MSLGYIGLARLQSENKEKVVYSYAGENWNDGGKSQEGDRLLQDGVIVILKRCFEEPEIHIVKRKSLSGKPKTTEKRIIRIPDIEKYFETGSIVIAKECKNGFYRYGCIHNNVECEYIARMLIFRIFTYYQEKGRLPGEVSFLQ